MRHVLRVLSLAALALAAIACNLSSETPTPVPSRDAPSVTFRFPVNDSTVVEGTDLQVQIVASDSGVGVARVELLVDDLAHQQATPLVSAAVPVFTVDMNWVARGVGLHALTAIAFRPDGTSSDPVTIRLMVLPREQTTPESSATSQQ